MGIMNVFSYRWRCKYGLCKLNLWFRGLKVIDSKWRVIIPGNNRLSINFRYMQHSKEDYPIIIYYLQNDLAKRYRFSIKAEPLLFLVFQYLWLRLDVLLQILWSMTIYFAVSEVWWCLLVYIGIRVSCDLVVLWHCSIRYLKFIY